MIMVPDRIYFRSHNLVPVRLVDDTPTFSRIAAHFLQEHDNGVVVGTAGGGEGVLAQAQSLQPDIVLIDLALPGLSGLLKSESEKAKHAL
ncbi:MAG: response regulator [Anaerolineae bacterium]